MKFPRIKIIFAAYFTVNLVLYLFFDDGGITAKVGADFVMIPIVSFVMAGIFALITYTLVCILQFLARKTGYL